MRTSRGTAIVSLVFFSALTLSIAGCTPATDATPAHGDTPAVRAATRVATVKPARGTVRRKTAQPGQIDANELTSIRAKVSGYVRSLAADIGDRVRKGQVLAELSVPELDAELGQKRALLEQAEADRKQAEAMVRVADAAIASAEAKVASVQAGVRRAEADVARWQAEYGRTSQLLRESAVTGTLLDETRSKLEAAQASREEIRAQIRSAEAARTQALAERDKARADVVSAAARVAVARSDQERALAMLSYTRIEAPFDGVVTQRNVDTGHLTVPGAGGELLFVVAGTGHVTITVGVPEADAPFVNPGDPAQVRLQSLGDRTFDGKVTRTAWALDTGTRTLRVEIDLPNEKDLLRPGLYAYATIISEEHPSALTVPTSAIVNEGDRAYCVSVVDGRAKRKAVKLGITEGNRTEVVTGLDGDETIVEASAGSLMDGQPVEVAAPAGAAARPKS